MTVGIRKGDTMQPHPASPPCRIPAAPSDRRRRSGVVLALVSLLAAACPSQDQPGTPTDTGTDPDSDPSGWPPGTAESLPPNVPLLDEARCVGISRVSDIASDIDLRIELLEVFQHDADGRLILWYNQLPDEFPDSPLGVFTPIPGLPFRRADMFHFWTPDLVIVHYGADSERYEASWRDRDGAFSSPITHTLQLDEQGRTLEYRIDERGERALLLRYVYDASGRPLHGDRDGVRNATWSWIDDFHADYSGQVFHFMEGSTTAHQRWEDGALTEAVWDMERAEDTRIDAAYRQGALQGATISYRVQGAWVAAFGTTFDPDISSWTVQEHGPVDGPDRVERTFAGGRVVERSFYRASRGGDGPGPGFAYRLSTTWTCR